MPAGVRYFDKVMHAMDPQGKGVFFGVSVTSMSNNIKEIFNENLLIFLWIKATYMVFSLYTHRAQS